MKNKTLNPKRFNMNPIALYSHEFVWQLKNALRYSPTLKRKGGLCDHKVLLRTLQPQQTQRLALLQQHYSLDDWPQLCTAGEYIENLYVLDLLHQHLGTAKQHGAGLDIGCRNFSHLPALSAFTQGSWTGVELDAHARYWNGFTRRAYGEWMARQRAGSRYIQDTLLHIDGGYQTIVWILPFVLPDALLYWGLPPRFFQPLALLQQAWQLLSPHGVMLIVNQGNHEADVQQQLFAQLHIPATALGVLSSVFSPFKKTRLGWIVRKE
jgi:hypothetical protein